ncbi:unnamed protein product [Oncorhynchus mykiss]|uniref:Uncharacterized protein n=1 Tax=Oncorhynchus mykiss TaxID=8022 RepID=A0A060WYW0_ONCMY|nr:unnamed protein product [Oncorhynchus mykiss]
MGVLLPILLALLASVLGGLYFLGAFRQRRPGEPPLDRGPIPWLGHVLEFRRDTAMFLERMKRKHGDIFTIQLGGLYFTFLMDPLSFGTVVKEARAKLDFTKFAEQLVQKVFGYHSMENDHKFLQMSSNKHLMGDGLVVMTQAMMSNLQNLMLHSVGTKHDRNKTWNEDGLFNYSYNIVFRAGYLALFGNETPKSPGSLEKAKEVDREESQELFREFRKYDQLFPNLAYGVLPPGEKREAERLKRLFWNMLSVQKMKTKDNISGWVREQQQLREEHGMEDFMQNRYMFLLLWASQGNTGPAAFWLLLYLMKHPEAMKAVQGEEVKHGGPLIDLTRDMLLKTPILDSAVEETLRLIAAPVLTRAVLQDMSLRMSDGNEYRIREGDRVALFPYTAVHIDPERWGFGSMQPTKDIQFRYRLRF